MESQYARNTNTLVPGSTVNSQLILKYGKFKKNLLTSLSNSTPTSLTPPQTHAETYGRQ
jgi:hypothetical protein